LRDPSLEGRGYRMGLEMGPLSSPVVTSYKLPIVTIDLSLTVFAVLRLVTDRQTDGRTDGISKRRQSQSVAVCTKVHRPPESLTPKAIDPTPSLLAAANVVWLAVNLGAKTEGRALAFTCQINLPLFPMSPSVVIVQCPQDNTAKLADQHPTK